MIHYNWIQKEGEIIMADINISTSKEKKSDTNQRLKTDEQTSLKGTLASVFILGIFILISWVSVFYLFINRN